MDDSWQLGEAYEKFMGRWSRPAAVKFIDWLAQPPGGRWLDIGCGTGALSETITQKAAPQSVLGIDASSGFIHHAQQRLAGDLYEFRVANVLDLPFKENEFDTAVSGLALNFFPEPVTAVREMGRVVKNGATVAAYVWDYAEGMGLLRYFWDAAIALFPDAAVLDEGPRFPLCRPEALQNLFLQAGLANVQVQSLETTAVFSDFDDYWQPFLGQNGPAPAFVASHSRVEQAALADKVREMLPVQIDGTIPLKLWAWAVRGNKSDKLAGSN
jgi:SAM-dependent methyltransferase